MTAGGVGGEARLLDETRLPRLEAWLAEKAGAGRVRVVDEGPLSGGAISLNLAVTLEIEGGALAGRHEAVLRTGSASGVSASLGKAQEGTVLRAAFAAGALAPSRCSSAMPVARTMRCWERLSISCAGRAEWPRAASWSGRMSRSGNWRARWAGSLA